MSDPVECNLKNFGSQLRNQFPIFVHSRQLKGKELCFLDSAASSQKPSVVIDRVAQYLKFEHSNIHRGAYELSAAATEAYEQARREAAQFLGSNKAENIIFTKGATESINLAALALQDQFIAGDKILISVLEHHSNIVPWQMLAKRKNLELHYVNIGDDGLIDLADFRDKVRQLKPKLAAFTMLSNALGTLTPFAEMTAIAKQQGTLVLLDAAQYSAHKSINVQDLGCDFLVFSAHKLYGPTGAGVLYASDLALTLMEPVYGGGDMISIVTLEGSHWAEPPQRFEAGTPAIAEVLGMATALGFLSDLMLKGLWQFEAKLFEIFFDALAAEPGVELYGPRAAAPSDLGQAQQSSIISFNIKDVHPHDFATIADQFNVQLRAGHHCAQPLMRRLGLSSSARISFGAYSDVDQLEPLLTAIRQARKMFS